MQKVQQVAETHTRPLQTELAGSRKAENALRTIGEVADELDVPQHVLRFWESKFSHLKPMKRRGGRRFYRPQDVDALRQIKHLLYDRGFTIKGAVNHLKLQKASLRDAGNDPALLDVQVLLQDDLLPDTASVSRSPGGSHPPLMHSSLSLELHLQRLQTMRARIASMLRDTI